MKSYTNSEDERIKREIIDFLAQPHPQFGKKDQKKWIDWLEKQGEQKVTVVNFKAKNWYVSKVDGKIYDATYVENIDEKIKRSLIGYFMYLKSIDKEVLTDITNDIILTWLEKQGEQKPDDEVKPKFKEGDFIVPDNITSLEIWKVINIGDDGYYNIQPITNIINTKDDEIYRVPGFIIEKDYHLWTIQDAKDGDVLMTTKTRNCPFIYRKTDYNNYLAYYYAGVDGNGDFCEGCLKRTMYHFGSVANITPATKEQRDLLLQKMKEAGYEWDSNKKELKKIEVASKESEDERIREELIAHCRNTRCVTEEGAEQVRNWIAWLEKQDANKEYVFRPLAGTTIENAIKQAMEQGDNTILAFNGAYIPIGGKTSDEILTEYCDHWLGKQGKPKMLNADEVIEWLDMRLPTGEGTFTIDRFKKDFKL